MGRAPSRRAGRELGAGTGKRRSLAGGTPPVVSGTVSRPARVIEAEPLGELRVRLTFSDGLVRELDLGPMLHGGVLEPLRDPVEFAGVFVDEFAGTIAWPNGVDMDPDVLHGDHRPASGQPPTVLREHILRQTG